jgi:hypothetical protein
MDKTELKKKVVTDEDFISYPKMSNSLTKLIAKYPDGVKDEIIMKCLMMTKDEFEQTYEAALRHLRSKLGVKAR